MTSQAITPGSFYSGGNMARPFRFAVRTGKAERMKAGALILPLFEGEAIGGAAARVDAVLGGTISRVTKRGDFAPKPGAVHPLEAGRSSAAPRLVLMGLGKRAEITVERIRQGIAKAAAMARTAGAPDAVLAFDAAGLDAALAGQAVAEGAMLGLYRFRRYKSVPRENGKDLQGLTVAVERKAQLPAVRSGASAGLAVAEATLMARDLVNTPSADMTPAHIAVVARRLGRTHRLRTTVIDRAGMKRLGMGALLAVSSGSSQPPRFIVAEYRGGGKRPWIALVGKTITFDSGGISIKPAEGMDKMKSDMAGGAAVLGAVACAARLKLPLNVVALLPATENMPSGSAYRPGDVLRTMSGKTIEVLNTDAEGRLILADALTYACRYKPAAIVDIATLTGACRIALGPEASGMLGTDNALKEQVRAAGERTNERVWELPLWDGYQELIKSDIADMKNTGGRDGGVITAACLLSRFVEKYPWVHLDIACTAWTDKDRPYAPKGATGVGVRLLTQFLRDYGRKPGRSGAAAG